MESRPQGAVAWRMEQKLSPLPSALVDANGEHVEQDLFISLFGQNTGIENDQNWGVGGFWFTKAQDRLLRILYRIYHFKSRA